ncbi:MAG: hypothetical protein K2O01_08605 [Bacteroidales bacterium]|nr:hypothetical protein [Bacteroidales bacterium]
MRNRRKDDMEIFAQIIFVLAIVQYSLQAALAGRSRWIPVYALAAALWAMVLYPWVITWPLTYLPSCLARPQWMADAVLIATVEAVATIMVLLGASGERPTKGRRICRILNRLPGPVFLFAVGYIESQYFGLRAGRHFMLTAGEYAGLMALLVAGLAFLWRLSLRPNVQKREMRILLSMAILTISLLLYAAIFPMPSGQTQTPVAWDALAALLAGAGLLFMGGRYVSFSKLKHLLKK